MDEHVVEFESGMKRCLVTGDPCGIASFSIKPDGPKEEDLCYCGNCKQYSERIMIQFLELKNASNIS